MVLFLANLITPDKYGIQYSMAREPQVSYFKKSKIANTTINLLFVFIFLAGCFHVLLLLPIWPKVQSNTGSTWYQFFLCDP